MPETELNLRADKRKYRRLCTQAETALINGAKEAQKVFDDATTEARAKYEKTIEPAQKEFDGIAKPAKAELDEKLAELKETYAKALVQARTDAGYDF